jgi:AcrR family transcriptional regulator
VPPASPAPVTRPGGRSARVRAAVHAAVEELLAEGGIEAVTVPAVAERAGVHPTTIYRRWPSVAELLTAVAISHFDGGDLVPSTGTLRGDLEFWLASVAADVHDPESLAIMRAGVGAGTDAAGCACVDMRVRQLEAMLEAERERGGEVPSLERARDALLAPAYFRVLFTDEPAPDEAWSRGLVAALLD